MPPSGRAGSGCTAGHHHAKKEIQVLSIDPPNVFEEFEVTVLGPTGGSYIVMFINPLFDPNVRGSQLTWMSDPIADDASASTVQSKLRKYFTAFWGSEIYVFKTDYDENDA